MRQVIPKNAKLIPKQAELVFKGKIFDVYQWQQELFDGSFDTFEMLKRPDTLRVFAIRDDKIVLLEQEQPGLTKFFDVPGGRHDFDKETELEASKRELLEETGMSFKSWRLITIEQPHGKIDWLIYTFLATEQINEIGPEVEAGEKIKPMLVTLEEFKALKDNPKLRFWPQNIFSQINNIEELKNFPEYSSEKL